MGDDVIDVYEPARRAMRRLLDLLDDPHPGLFTWQAAVDHLRFEVRDALSDEARVELTDETYVYPPETRTIAVTITKVKKGAPWTLAVHDVSNGRGEEDEVVLLGRVNLNQTMSKYLRSTLAMIEDELPK